MNAVRGELLAAVSLLQYRSLPGGEAGEQEII